MPAGQNLVTECENKSICYSATIYLQFLYWLYSESILRHLRKLRLGRKAHFDEYGKLESDGRKRQSWLK